MKTVIQVVQHLSPGGIEVMALELKKCNQKNMRMLIVSLEGEKTSSVQQWKRLEEFQHDLLFMNKQPGFDFSLIPRLTQLFKNSGAEVVHTHHIGPLIYGGIAARLSGIKRLIHTEHDAWHLSNLKRCCLERITLAVTHPYLVADADVVADQMAYRLKKKEVHVIKNGIDVEHFCPGDEFRARHQLKLPIGVKIIGCAGRLEHIKGQSHLIHALRKLDEHIHVAFAGDGSQREYLEGLSHRLGLENRIHFLGSIDDMPCFYQAIDAFCLPSLREGMPLSVLEAQACGVPAVISDTGGAKEALCHNSGYLVVPGDSDAIAKGLNKILNESSNVNPRVFVENVANLQTMAKAYAELCKTSGEAA